MIVNPSSFKASWASSSDEPLSNNLVKTSIKLMRAMVDVSKTSSTLSFPGSENIMARTADESSTKSLILSLKPTLRDQLINN